MLTLKCRCLISCVAVKRGSYLYSTLGNELWSEMGNNYAQGREEFGAPSKFLRKNVVFFRARNAIL